MLLTPWLSGVNPLSLPELQTFIRHNRRHRRRRENVLAWVETLESRLVLSSVNIVGNDLVVTGAAADNDQLTIRSLGSTFVISDSVNLNMTFTFGSFSGQIIVNTGDGNDSLTIDFSQGNFTRAITFNGGDGDDMLLTASPLAAGSSSAANLTINGDAGNDTVQWNASVTLSNGNSFKLDVDQIVVGNNAQIMTQGLNTLGSPGTIDLRASRSIALSPGVGLQTDAGDLTLEANQGTSPTLGDFVGISLNGGAMVSSISGNVTLKGRGGNGDAGGTVPPPPPPPQIGIWLDGGSIVIGGDGSLGSILTIIGVGGAGSGGNNFGVRLIGRSTIVSNGSDVMVTGTGGGKEMSDFNLGVSVAEYSRITSYGGNVEVTGQGGNGTEKNYGVEVIEASAIANDGSGTVTVEGTGGGATHDNYGVYVHDTGSAITSSGGDVTVTGFGSTLGIDGNYGVWVENSSTISAGGAGNVKVDGTGGGTAGSMIRNGNVGVKVGGSSTITSAGGNVEVIGQGGGQEASSYNYGVWLSSSAGLITSAGTSSAVKVSGTGGSGSGPFNHGLVWEGPSSNITSNGGAILVTGRATPGQHNFAIAIHRDNLILNPATTTLDGGTGTVLLRPQTPNTLINLGGADVLASPGPLTLGLADDELDLITAGQLVIGDPMSGTMTVTAAITLGLNLTIASGAGITINQPITLDADRNLMADVDVFGPGGSLQLATGTANIAVSGMGMIVLSAGTIMLANGSSLMTDDSPIMLRGNNINLAGSVSAGAGMVSVVGKTDGRPIQLGTENAGAISLSNTELDNVTAGEIHFGDTKSGPITINAAINRIAATHLSLTTMKDSDITFLSGGSLDANGGDVSLFTDFTGDGAIIGNAGVPSIRGNLLSLGAGSGGIGSATTPVSFDAVNLRTMTGGDGHQFLSEVNSVGIFGGGAGGEMGGLNAGSGTINFNGGTFVLGGSNRINDGADVALAFGSTLDLGPNIEAIDQLMLIDGNITGNGTLTGSSPFDLRKGAISVNLAQPLGLSVGVLKTEPDTVTLSGPNNTYRGGTTISAGTLALVSTMSNNSIPTTTTITLQPGTTLDVTGLNTIPTAATLILASRQTLQGTGVVAGKIIAPSGSSISPGNSPGIISSGSINLQNGSTLNMEVNGNTPGTGHDQLDVTGSVMLGGATLNLSGTISSQPGQQIVLINNDGLDPVLGQFNGVDRGPINEGSTVTINSDNGSMTFIVSYAGGVGGNDVTLTQAGGTVTFEDLNASGADVWSVGRAGGNIQILNGGSIVDSRPSAAGTAVIINGEANQDDTLILDFANGNVIPSAGLSFDGGLAGNDSLEFINVGAMFATHTYNYTNANDGSVVLSNGTDFTVNYIGLEPIDNDGTAIDVIFNLPDGGNSATLIDAGGGMSQLLSNPSTFEMTTFMNPTGSLTINGGSGNDTLDASAFNLAVTLNGGDGADLIIGGSGDDSLVGGDGGDIVDGRNGFDSILGGNGDDSLLGGNDDDAIDGQTGNDTIDGQAGSDLIGDNDGDPSIVTVQQGDNLFREYEQQILDQKALTGFDSPEVLALLLQFAEQTAQALGLTDYLVFVVDPVDFLVTDPQGQQAGFTAATGLVNNIPGSYYSGNGAVELLIVPLPVEGTYSVLFAGLGGPFNVAIASSSSSETQSTVISQSLSDGANLQVSINVGGPSAIPVGLGLGGNGGSSGVVAFGVVGGDDELARNDAAAKVTEDLISSLELALDESNVSPFDQLVNWIRSAQATREKIVQDLFESLDLPFGNLLDADAEAGSKLTEQLIELFWKRLGQSLTGVPAGAFRVGDMLESLLPKNPSRPSNKTPAERGKNDSGTNGKSTPKTKRSTETRPRTVPRSSEKAKNDPQPVRS